MKIIELEARHVRIPLKRPIRHASHRRTETDNVVVRCVLDDGTVGHGEGVPRDYVTGETIDGVLALLARSGLRDRLEPTKDVHRAADVAERLKLDAADERGIAGNAARCAAELAYLDACGRAGGWPLSRLTEAVAPDCHHRSARVRYSGVITSAKGWKLRLVAFGQGLYGFAHMKLKVGIEGQDDVKRLRLLRGWGGRALDIRVDANEAWSPAEAAARIRALEPLGITSVEQPVRHEDVACLSEVRKQVNTPIMLDESLCGPADADRAVREKLCDAFNLRLSKCGGFVATLRLAQMARRAGLACQLGCQVGETAILSAAGRHFASSVSGLRFVEGSYDGWLVREALATTNLTFGRGGWAPALAGGGLGIDIDPKALDRVTVKRVPL